MSRRGHRRVVAPPTAAPDSRDGAATADAADSGEVDWFTRDERSEASGAESERDRWLREQRPPHWE